MDAPDARGRYGARLWPSRWFARRVRRQATRWLSQLSPDRSCTLWWPYAVVVRDGCSRCLVVLVLRAAGFRATGRFCYGSLGFRLRCGRVASVASLACEPHGFARIPFGVFLLKSECPYAYATGASWCEPFHCRDIWSCPCIHSYPVACCRASEARPC